MRKCVLRGLKITQCLEESYCGVDKIEHFISGYGIKVTGYVIDGKYKDEIEGLTGCDFSRYETSCMQVKGIEILECLNEANCYGLAKIEHVLGENLENEGGVVFESGDIDQSEIDEGESESIEMDEWDSEKDGVNEEYNENDEIATDQNNIDEKDEVFSQNIELDQQANEINELGDQANENREIELNKDLGTNLQDISNIIGNNQGASDTVEEKIDEDLKELENDTKDLEYDKKIKEELQTLQELLRKSFGNVDINDFYTNLERMKKEIDLLEQDVKEKELVENEISESIINSQDTQNTESIENHQNLNKEENLIEENEDSNLMEENEDINLNQPQELQDNDSEDDSDIFINEDYEKNLEQEDSFNDENKDSNEVNKNKIEENNDSNEVINIIEENKDSNEVNINTIEEYKDSIEVNKGITDEKIDLVRDSKVNGNISQQDRVDLLEIDSESPFIAVSVDLDNTNIENIEANEQIAKKNEKINQFNDENHKITSEFTENNEEITKDNENIAQTNLEIATNSEDIIKTDEKTAENITINKETLKLNPKFETQNNLNQFLKTKNFPLDECSEDCKNICLKKSEQETCMKECISNFCTLEITSNPDYYTVILTGAVLFLIVGIIYLFMQNKSMRMAIEHGEFGLATYSNISS